MLRGLLARAPLATTLASRATIGSRTPALRRLSTATPPAEAYSKRMDKTGRPISPHVFGETAPMPNVTDLMAGKAGIYALPAIAVRDERSKF